ncbi:MAG: hypothetical protein ABI471_01235 [Sphingomonas bacterium]
MIYKPEFAEQASTMCQLGATDEELAEHFEVCVRTIYRWRNTHEEFADAVVIGKYHADARVERALYSRAVGCSVERTKVFRHAGDEKPVCATYTHHYPPDPNAALQWLRTRQPKKWIPREEKQSDPGAIEMIEKALARADAYTSTLVPPLRPPPEASAPQPAPQPEPPSEPAPGPAPPPDPILPPRPGPEPGRDPEQDATQERPSREWDGPSPIWDPKPMLGPSRWHYENGRNRPP